MPAPQVCIFGNVTADPTLKYATSGSAWGYFTIANTTYKKDENDNWVENKSSFYDVKVFGQMMENVSESVPKGTSVIVTGRLEQETWEKDGEKRSKMVITADNVAVSLKNATAEVTRIKREDSSSREGYSEPTTSSKADEEPFLSDAGEWSPSLGFGEYPSRLLP